MSAEARAKSALTVLRRRCKAAGMDPDIECFMQKEREGVWHVSWESGPFDWAIPASMAMISANGRLVEPYYGFDLYFYEEE